MHCVVDFLRIDLALAAKFNFVSVGQLNTLVLTMIA